MTVVFTPGDLPAETTAQYLQALEEHWLPVEHCRDCQRVQWYPRGFCTRCCSDAVSLLPAAGRGTLYSYTVVYRGVPDAAFLPYTPYVFALVDLVEGVRVATWITDCPHEELRVDLPVELHFIDGPLGSALPVFRPAVRREA